MTVVPNHITREELAEVLDQVASVLESYNIPALRSVFEEERGPACKRAYELIVQIKFETEISG